MIPGHERIASLHRQVHTNAHRYRDLQGRVAEWKSGQHGDVQMLAEMTNGT